MKKRRKGSAHDMNNWVSNKTPLLLLIVKSNTTKFSNGLMSCQERKKGVWYLSMRKLELIKLLNWKSHWKRRSRYLSLSLSPLKNKKKKLVLISPCICKHVSKPHFLFMNSGWQNFQRSEKDSWLISGEWRGHPGWWLNEHLTVWAQVSSYSFPLKDVTFINSCNIIWSMFLP